MEEQQKLTGEALVGYNQLMNWFQASADKIGKETTVKCIVYLEKILPLIKANPEYKFFMEASNYQSMRKNVIDSVHKEFNNILSLSKGVKP